MHFASYSDEQTAPIKGYRAASAKAISWGPHNIIALATKHNIQFNLHSHSTHNPSTPMRCDVMEELKPSPATYIESVCFSPYVLSAEARDRVMITGSSSSSSTCSENENNKRKSTPSNASLGAALCAFKTVSSTIDVIPVERVHATLETMKPIILGPRKITILPQLRPIPHSAPQRLNNNNNTNTPHIPAFSYHLIDFHWLSAASLVLVTSIGLLYVDLCEEFDGVKKTLSPAALHKLSEAQSIRYKKGARDTAPHVRVKAEGGREQRNDNHNDGKGEEEDTLDLSLLDDLLKGITPSASNLSAQPSNSTPTTTIEPKRRIASWPQGFGPACSTIVEVDVPPVSSSSSASASVSTSTSSSQLQLRSSSSTHHLLIVSGLLTVSGRQQNILLGYDLTTIAASFHDDPSQQQQQQIPTLETQTTCLCRCAFAINTSTKVFSIVTNFSRVVNSTALASSDSLVPSAISASIVASSATGVTPREAENISLRTPPLSMVGPGRRMNVVELVLSGPSVTILAHLSTLAATVPIAVPKDTFSIVSSAAVSASASASYPSLLNAPTVSTSITGAAIIARWGSSLGPVVVPPSSAASPLPSAQILAPVVDTISNHHQDPNICRIIRLRGSGQGVLGGDGLMPLLGSGDSFSRRVLSSVDIVTTTQTISSQTQGLKPLPPLSSASASNSSSASASANNNNKKMTIAEKLIAAKAAQDAARKATQPVSESATSPTTAAATPQRVAPPSPALVSTAMAATIDSHYILVGSETITVIGIVRTHFNSTSSVSATAPTTVTVYSDTLIDILKISTMNHLAGIDSSVPPLAFVGGVVMHPSGSVGAMLAGVVRQRKDEIRLIHFTTPFSPLYSEAMVRFLEQRALLATLSSGAVEAERLNSGKKIDENNSNDHNNDNYNNHLNSNSSSGTRQTSSSRHFLSGGDKFSVTPPVDLISSGENSGSSSSNTNEGGGGSSSVASLASHYAAHGSASSASFAASSSSSLSPNLLSVVGKVGDDCQRLKDMCFAVLSGPKDPLENPAGALFLTTAASLLSYSQQQQNAFVKSISGSSNLVALLSQQPVLGHKGVFQLGSDLEKAISRAVISFVISCVTGEAQITYTPSTAVYAESNYDSKASLGHFMYNDAVTTALYSDPAWDVQLIDPAAMIPTNQCVPAYLTQIETFTARLLISLCELCFEQIDSGQFVLSSTGGAAASGMNMKNKSNFLANFLWSQGRRSFGMDVYRRHPMYPPLHAKAAESSPTRRSMPAWQRSLVSARTLIRCVEMHRTHSAAALDWLKSCRRRLTMELLFARAVTVAQIYLHTPLAGNGGGSSAKSLSSGPSPSDAPLADRPSTTAVSVALAIIEAILKATRRMELVAPSVGVAFIPHTSVVSASDLVNKVLENAKHQREEEEEEEKIARGGKANGPREWGRASVAWLVNDGGSSSRVRVAQPYFLSSFSEAESANNEETQQVSKEEGGTKKAKKRRREAGADGSASADGSPFFSFVSAPLSVTLPAAQTDVSENSREFFLVDGFTFEPMHSWGTESTLRCASGCGQVFLERNPAGIACPLCLGQLVKE